MLRNRGRPRTLQMRLDFAFANMGGLKIALQDLDRMGTSIAEMARRIEQHTNIKVGHETIRVWLAEYAREDLDKSGEPTGGSNDRIPASNASG